MRINRDTLLRIASETVQQRVHADRDILAACVVGSLAAGEPLLGGTADIDLLFIHDGAPRQGREIVPLSHEIHLDIQHHGNTEYARPRDLRVDAWSGADVYAPVILHDTRHFLDYVQASVRDRYNEPENVLARSRSLMDRSRRQWSALQISQAAGAELTLAYLDALQQAANAVAVLNGSPLAERRLLLEFPARVEIVGRPGLYPGLLGLMGINHLEAASLAAALPAWQADMHSAAERSKCPLQLHPARQGYYQRAIESLEPAPGAWILLSTWTLAASTLPASRQKAWLEFISPLGLDESALNERLEGLDLYLDDIEDLLETLASQDGV